MRRIIFSLLIVCSTNLLASEIEISAEAQITPQQINRSFDEQYKYNMKVLPDILDKTTKVTSCINEYVKKQSKSYSKIVQNNLYDLMNNFDRITSRIYGKKQLVDEISYEDKVEALAIVQCEAYYAMGALK
jgi:hypothetical protein